MRGTKMTPETPDESRPAGSSRQPRETPDSDAVARLEQALAAETRTCAALRDSLEELRAKVERLEAGFTQRLEEAARRDKSAEGKLSDQQQRLSALGTGREETMRQLTESRTELARVRAERDQLLKQAERVEGMQTSTVALTEQEQAEEPGICPLPSMDELMASLRGLDSAAASPPPGGHLLARVTLDEQESQEMIAPELVFPEEYGAGEKDEPEPSSSAASHATNTRVSRVLVFLDAPKPIKYPLYKKVMTIGRSEEADIHVPGDFISRVHARLVATTDGILVEDVSSKNGIKVNSKHTDRQLLHHGDVLGIGRLRFTFIDTSATAISDGL
jgi:FHA domain